MVIVILAVGALICTAVAVFMCLRPKEPESHRIIIESRALPPDAKRVILDPSSGQEMDSVVQMLQLLEKRAPVQIEGFLRSVHLEKQLQTFLGANIYTLDEFMALEPDQLDVLDIGDAELAIILSKIEEMMDEEDARLEKTFHA